MSSNASSSGGIGFLGVLTIVFIVLKLVEKIGVIPVQLVGMVMVVGFMPDVGSNRCSIGFDNDRWGYLSFRILIFDSQIPKRRKAGSPE